MLRLSSQVPAVSVPAAIWLLGGRGATLSSTGVVSEGIKGAPAASEAPAEVAEPPLAVGVADAGGASDGSEVKLSPVAGPAAAGALMAADGAAPGAVSAERESSAPQPISTTSIPEIPAQPSARLCVIPPDRAPAMPAADGRSQLGTLRKHGRGGLCQPVPASVRAAPAITAQRARLAQVRSRARCPTCTRAPRSQPRRSENTR